MHEIRDLHLCLGRLFHQRAGGAIILTFVPGGQGGPIPSLCGGVHSCSSVSLPAGGLVGLAGIPVLGPVVLLMTFIVLHGLG